MLYSFKSLRNLIRCLLIGNSIDFYTKKELLFLSKAFNKLKKNSNLELIQILKSDLINTPLIGNTLEEALKIPENINLIQFLNYRKLNFDFTKNILLSHYDKKKYIHYGLPFKWRKKLKDKGFKISIKSVLNWEIYKITWLFVGLFYGLNKIIIFFYFIKPPKVPRIHLYGVNIFNDPKRYFFFDWLRNQKEMSSIKIITLKSRKTKNHLSDYNVNLVNDDLPGIESISNLFIFLFWLIKYFFLGLIKSDLFNLIFIERVKRKLVSLANKKSLAKVYMLDNQYQLMRPLWTYEDKSKDFKVILFFYSTNNYSFKFKNKNFKQQFNWELSNYPIYWVWDKTQYSFLKQNCKHIFDVNIKGPIPYFGSKKHKFFKSNSLSLLIFDVQPYKETIYPLLGIENNYYSFETSKVFFEDIVEISKELHINVFFKRKRSNKYVSMSYLSFLKKLKINNKNLYEIDPEVSPFEILRGNNFSISINMPYTSTAIISQFNKIPTIYYDPTNLLDQKYYALGEIKLIQSKQKLKSWLVKQILVLNSKDKLEK